MKKRCTGCKQEKDTSAFSSNRSSKDGLCKYCRPCRQAYRKARQEQISKYNQSYRLAHLEEVREKDRKNRRRYYKANREKALEDMRIYNKAHPEVNRKAVQRYRKKHPSRVLEQRHQYAQSHAEELRESGRKYYAENTEKHAKAVRRWQDANREKFNGYSRRRRALKCGVNEVFTGSMGNFVHDFWNRECALCGSETKLCIDHWLPLSKGHALTMDNAVLLCKTCNSKKRAKLPESFLARTVVNRIERKLRKQASTWKLAHRSVPKAAVQ